MNKKSLFLIVLLFILTQANAEDVLTVGNVTLPQNGEVALEISGTFETNFTQFQLEIVLDEGLQLTQNKNYRPWAEMGDPSTDHTISSSEPAARTSRFVGSSMSQEPLPSDGVLMRVKIIPDGTPEVGTVFQGTVKNIILNEHTSSGNVGHAFPDMVFTVTIGDPVDSRTMLDESTTTPPEAATGVDVRVKRTINANEWSTLVLPFDMTESQVAEAFGADAQLGDFTAWESEEDEDGNITAINVTFDVITAIEANHPVIIKTTKDITEFTADGVDIEPEEEPTVQVGKKKAERGYFTGTFVANTTVPEYNLFLSENLFWYSVGLTKMKALRAYFEFADVLTNVEEAGAKVNLNFNDNTNLLVSPSSSVKGNNCYNLQGQRVSNNYKGIVIENGKKVKR